MPTIRTILFPMDFSDASIGTARYVEALAGRFQAKLVMLHVIDDWDRLLAQEVAPKRQEQLDGFLKDELSYLTVERVCVIGQPDEEIVATARAKNVDLVMMPTHGWGRYRRLLLGSVTAKVLHDLDCPVWTAVHTENAPKLENITCRKILCAVDLEARTRCVLEYANFLAREYQAELMITHALPAVEASPPGRFLDEEFNAMLAREAEKRIRELQASTGADGTVLIERGDPAKATAELAAARDADLVVIGRHSRNGIAAYLRQNAYAIMRDAPCPVISI